MDFNKFYETYKKIYNDICEIGDYIFVYLGKYEKLYYKEKDNMEQVLKAQEELRKQLEQNETVNNK